MKTREKNLWFGTYDGLNLYNPSRDNFKVFKKTVLNNNSLNSNCITGIVEDKKGNLWVVSDGCCLNRWNPKNQNFTRYPFEYKDMVCLFVLQGWLLLIQKGIFGLVH
jgi:ligand-binding sensor domain-containing protein